VSDGGGKRFCVHQQQVDVGHVLDHEGLVSRGHHVLGLLVASIPDLGHHGLSLKPPADSVVDPLWLSPCLLHGLVAVALVPLKGRPALLHNGRVRCCCCHGCVVVLAVVG